MFQSVFNLVLSISKTHLIVKLETFPHLRRARAGFGWGRGAVCPPRNKPCGVYIRELGGKHH
jgi:hypothetical protein